MGGLGDGFIYIEKPKFKIVTFRRIWFSKQLYDDYIRLDAWRIYLLRSHWTLRNKITMSVSFTFNTVVSCASQVVIYIYRSWPDHFCLFAVADTVVNEFAALAVSFMATEFSSKVTIFDNGGVEPLVRLLSSSDPDVQKNSIEALAQMALVGTVIVTLYR